MSSYPQCPRCGDSLTEIVSVPKSIGHDFPAGACKICYTELTGNDYPGGTSLERAEALQIKSIAIQTLRDKLACAALPELVAISQNRPVGISRDAQAKWAAENAYLYADAMIAARAVVKAPAQTDYTAIETILTRAGIGYGKRRDTDGNRAILIESQNGAEVVEWLFSEAGLLLSVRSCGDS